MKNLIIMLISVLLVGCATFEERVADSEFDICDRYGDHKTSDSDYRDFTYAIQSNQKGDFLYFRSKLKNELFKIPTEYLFSNYSKQLYKDYEVKDWLKAYNAHCAPGFPEAYYKTEYYKQVARENVERNREIEQLRKKLQPLNERISAFEKSNNYNLMLEYESDSKKLSNYKESIKNLIPFRFNVIGQIIRRDTYTKMIYGVAIPIENPMVFTDCATLEQTKLTVAKWKSDSIDGSGLVFSEHGMYCVRPGIYSGEPPRDIDPKVKRFFQGEEIFHNKYNQAVLDSFKEYEKLKQEKESLNQKITETEKGNSF